MKKSIGKTLLRIGDKVLRPVYKLYEKWLWLQIKDGPFPVHIGIIPDGNRRWAKLHNMAVWYGHEYGYKRIQEVLTWIWELGVKAVTIYAMSTENCTRRPPEERNRLFEIAERALRQLLESKEIYERKIRVKIFGNMDLVPPRIVELARRVEEATRNHRERFLNIALCYGGRQEIVEAVRRIAEKVARGELRPENIDEELFSNHLYTGGLPDPDLIIRTSGEVRISNFLLWQLAYSELYFCDVYWPEFRKIDFWRAIRSYQHRERRFGR